MLGVLMAAARPGQARPTFWETSDFIRGGLQVRVARVVAGAAGTGWRDAFAVTGVLIPLIMSLNAVRLALEWWSSLPICGYGTAATSSVAVPASGWTPRLRRQSLTSSARQLNAHQSAPCWAAFTA